MKLVCPQCRTSYDVTPAALGPDGRQVRCARCQSVWYADPPRLAANVIPLAAHDSRAAPLRGASRAAPAAPPPAAEIAAAGLEPATASEAPAPNADGAAPTELGAAVAAGAPAADSTAAAPEAAPAIPPVDIESVAARRLTSPKVKRLPRASWRLHKLVAATVVLAVIDAGLIVGRADVVRMLPQAASLFETIGLPVNLRDLAFKDVRTAQETHDGVSILVIEGTIVATGRAVADVPRLRFAIGAANGHEIYAWTALPTRTKLAPGETLAFRTRLASPPEQGRSVTIRFFTRLDLASGLS